MLAQLWTAEGIEAVLEVLSRSAVAREHEVIHDLHAQAVECERTAPHVAAQLDRVAGQLTEIHAALRAAEPIASLPELLRWQVEAPWRLSGPMQQLLAALASTAEPAAWPWRIEALPRLQAELDRLLVTVRELVGVPAAERWARLGADPRLSWPELAAWLAARAGLGDADAAAYARLHEHLLAWRHGRGSEAPEPRAGAGAELAPLAELVELWYRLDPELDATCRALATELAAGQRALAEALELVATGVEEPERSLERRAALLLHALEQPGPSLRREALVAITRLVASLEAQALEPGARATLVLRWAAALELSWRVLPDPASAFEGALRLVDHVRAAVGEGATPRLARDFLVLRARLLRRLAGWRDAVLDEALQAHQRALAALDDLPSPGVRGRVLGDLAGLRRARRSDDPRVQDREVRASFDEALEELRDAVVLRARVLGDYATYLARPAHAAEEDTDLALALASEAVARLEGLPDAASEHPLVRIELAAQRLTLGNVRLEVGSGPPSQRRAEAAADYRRALERLGPCDEVLAGLLHLALALVALGEASQRRRDEPIDEARARLDRAVPRLGALPVAHGRAIAERAMLELRAAADDEPLRMRQIAELEAALQRLPLGSDHGVRARLQRELGQLHLHGDGPDDLQRAAEHFAAARGGFVEGGAVRLAVEAARDYAECQLRQHADEGDPAALTRGAVVLEQAALLAEQRWAARDPGEPIEELVAMLDGVHGDLAWLLARLGRPPKAVLHAVTRAKRHRAAPSLWTLQHRAERSSMLEPAYLDPLARRSRSLAPTRRGVPSPGPSAARLHERALAFAGANPRALALDLTLTRWGTVVVAVSPEGVAYITVPLSRETVRRWVWGDGAALSSGSRSGRVPGLGWWRRHLAHRQATLDADDEQVHACERAWVEAGATLAKELGSRLLEPIAAGLGLSFGDRALLLAPGRLSGLPFGAARVGGDALVAQVAGLVRIASLADLPAGPLPDPRPGRALCVLADAHANPPAAVLDELQDVVRLLASGQAEVEVLARLGPATGSAVHRPTKGRTRERTVVSTATPTVDEVLARVPHVDHLFYGGHGRAEGLVLFDAAGREAQLDAAALARGPRWAAGSSVLVSAATHWPPPVDDAATWELVGALHGAGVEVVIVATHAVPAELAREVSRGLYFYWALGRGLLEACAAALANVAGSDPSRVGAFVVSLGPSGESEEPPPRGPAA